jgi:hypothetical protein
MNALACLLSLGVAPPLFAVIPVNGDGLISPAHYFDLQGKTVRFTPSRGGYAVGVSKAKAAGDPGKRLERPDYPSFRSYGWRIPLPFEFPFAGEARHEVFVNSAGNLTFERPESQLYPERDTWPSGTVQSVAGSLNDRAAAGQEKMICVLWGLYNSDWTKSKIFVRRAAAEFVVTWQVERQIRFGEGYRPLGPNVFQARLLPDGTIEFTYEQVSEKDGIVGLFYGATDGYEFDRLSPIREESPDPRMKIRMVSAALAGRTLRFTFEMANPVGRNVPEGTMWYRVFLNRGSHSCEIGFEVSRWSRPYLLRECVGVPGVRVSEKRLDIYVSTFEADQVLGSGMKWNADVLWGGRRDGNVAYSAGEDAFHWPSITPKPTRLAAAKGEQDGNLFEIFHYPEVSKSVFPLLRYIYQKFPPQDDMAVVMTDFRIDDLHNHQGSTGGGYNEAIQGIGSGEAAVHAQSSLMGSAKLQVATGPIYPGPRFDEFLEEGDAHYRNYANAVGWLAHELSHRWGVDLTFRSPASGMVESLAGGDGHWSNFLNTPSMFSVWRMFSDKPYSEKSQMEGYVYEIRPNGDLCRIPNAWNLPTGFSGLDLYLMGLIGPDETPETFLLENPVIVGPNLYRGMKTTVRIQDVIAVNGARRPNYRESQKEFVIGIYLLHPGNRAVDAEKLRQVEGIEKALVAYFGVATGGKMKLVPATRGARLVSATPPVRRVRQTAPSSLPR